MGVKTVAGFAVCSVMALSTTAGAAASTLPPTGDSEGFAQLISSSLLNSELLDVATAHAINPDGPLSDVEPLNLALLQSLDLQLSDGGLIQVPLIGTDTVPGLLNLGQVGAVQSAAFAPARSNATAASGVVGADGTISISQENNPSDIGNSIVNVTSLLDQLGLDLDGVINEVAFQVGAVAARAVATEDVVVTDYRVADLKATVDAPIVGDLVVPIRGAVDTFATALTTAVNDLVGEDSVLQNVLDEVPSIAVNVGLTSASVTLGDATIAVTPPDVSAVVDDLLGGSGAVFVSDDESITVDLVTGTVTIDLAEIVNPGGNGLNGLAPNTDVLTAATITKITNGIGKALGKVSAAVTTATLSALESAAVQISVPLAVSGTPMGMPLVNITGAVTVSMTVTGTDVPGQSPSPIPPATTPPATTPPPSGQQPGLPNTGADRSLALPGLAALVLGAVCLSIGATRKVKPRQAA